MAPPASNATALPRLALALPSSIPMADAAKVESRVALIDGSNVAHSTEGDVVRLENIRLVAARLVEEGYAPVIVADAALRHQIDEKAAFEAMVEEGRIRQAPAGTDADFFILSFARELDAVVVSNDRFKDRLEAFPEARDQVIRFMIVNDEVVFERRTSRR
jgi:hypothetical protein